MVDLKIKIQSLEDVKNGKPLFEGVTKDNVERLDKMSVGILEGGTVKGKTSVIFMFKDGDKYKYAELTADLINGLASAVSGAVARFGK